MKDAGGDTSSGDAMKQNADIMSGKGSAAGATTSAIVNGGTTTVAITATTVGNFTSGQACLTPT